MYYNYHTLGFSHLIYIYSPICTQNMRVSAIDELVWSIDARGREFRCGTA